MKILILSFYFYPDLCAGSFRCTALVDQLKHQLGQDAQIEVLTTMPNRYATYDASALAFEKQSNVTIRRIQLPKHTSGMLDQAWAFLYFAKTVNQLTKKQNYDLVFATSSRLMTVVLGAWVARHNKAKLYLDVRDLFVDLIHDLFPKQLARCLAPFFSWLERWTFRRADRINLVSKGFADYIKQRYPVAQLSWFSNGIDTEFLAVDAKQKETKSFSKPLTVLYAGNIGEGQGLHLIIPELVKKMGDRVHFRIIGDGGRGAQLKAATQGLTQVELMPPMKRQQLITAYRQADVLFLHLNDYPAFRKVLPSKIFEYAALGKPIWAGVEGYASEFIQTEIVNAAVFSPCDSEAAVQAFATLDLNTTLRTEFIEKYNREHIMSLMAKDIISQVS